MPRYFCGQLAITAVVNIQQGAKMKAKTISRKTVLVGILAIISWFSGGLTASAGMGGGGGGGGYSCSYGDAGCHQMHGGESPYNMAPGYGGNEGCINCHSSDTSSTTYVLNPGGDPEIVVPVVVYTGSDEPTNYLAGGNFWWVKEGLGGDDTKGHNIFSGEPDDNLSSAPLSASGCTSGNFCHANLYTEYTGAEGTRQGCTKCHMMQDGGWGGFHQTLSWEVIPGTVTVTSASSRDICLALATVFVGLRMTTGRPHPIQRITMNTSAIPVPKILLGAFLCWATP